MSAAPSTTVAPTTLRSSVTDVPSQSAADAARDGVVAEIAALPPSIRIVGVASADAPEGRWIASELDVTAVGPDGCDVRGGLDIGGLVCAGEYGEVVLLDPAGRIEQASSHARDAAATGSR